MCHMVLNCAFILNKAIRFLDIPNGKDLVNSLFVRKLWCYIFEYFTKTRRFFNFNILCVRFYRSYTYYIHKTHSYPKLYC